MTSKDPGPLPRILGLQASGTPQPHALWARRKADCSGRGISDFFRTATAWCQVGWWPGGCLGRLLSEQRWVGCQFPERMPKAKGSPSSEHGALSRASFFSAHMRVGSLGSTYLVDGSSTTYRRVSWRVESDMSGCQKMTRSRRNCQCCRTRRTQRFLEFDFGQSAVADTGLTVPGF